MKRVLQIVNLMNRGGIETFLMNIYRNIDRTKIQFDFVVRKQIEGDYDKEIKRLGGNIYYIPSRRDCLYHNKKKWNEFYKNHPEYETVHYHVSSLSDIIPIVTAKKNHIKNVIVHAHSTRELGSIHTILHDYHKKLLGKYCKTVYACSDKAAEFMYNPELLKKAIYLKNGINIKDYTFSQDIRNKIRKEYNISEDTIVIGHVGRFEYPKNHTFLIDIFKQLNDTKKNTLLMLVGGGKLEQEIKGKVKSLGLEEKVLFLGVREDVNALLMAMDILVFPSLYEGLPVSLVEAQATGLKCFISSTISKQVDITGLIKFLDLSIPPKEWSMQIEKEYPYVRQDVSSKIIDNGYAIQETVKILEKVYNT